MYGFRYSCGTIGAVMLEDFDKDFNGMASEPAVFNNVDTGTPTDVTVNNTGLFDDEEKEKYPLGDALILNAFPSFETEQQAISDRTVFYEDLEDEWEDKGVPIIASAENEGINIAPFDTYTKGLEALKKEPKRWVSVILDIREQAAEQGAATDNFHIAREQFKEFQILNHQTEPYVFVLTGEPNYLDSDAFPKLDYASKRVYSKSLDDYKLLFEDIKKISKYSTS